MFEFSIALKYLIPRRKQLSVSLIALMSVGVISVVVWLVLVFLSVTQGIEQNWLDKLTKLNAPLRITPTENYYASYYYQIDTLSAASHFRPQSIAEKALKAKSDPFVAEEDGELPLHFPAPDLTSDGTLIDPVQKAYQILSEMQDKYPGFVFQDYEVGGALMRLQMLRPQSHAPTSQGGGSQSFLTQASYIASFPDKSPYAASLVLPPRAKDLNHLFFLSSHKVENVREDAATSISSLSEEKAALLWKTLASCSQIKALKNPSGFWRMPPALLPKGALQAMAYFKDGRLTHLILPLEKREPIETDQAKTGVLTIKSADILFHSPSCQPISIPASIPLIVEGDLVFQAELISESLLKAKKPKEIQFRVLSSLQGQTITGTIPWEGLEIAAAEVQTVFSSNPPTSLPWLTHRQTSDTFQSILPISSEKETGVLLAKSFQDNGVLIGDKGYLAYTTSTAGSVQEQRLPIFVSGFYDPGVLSIGSKVILVPGAIAHTINAASSSFNLDKTQAAGIQVWFQKLSDAKQIKEELQLRFLQAHVDPYWKVTTFEEYDFAKDLLEQFQSDKYLFTLIGIIILLVACCNIISLLVLLVNDKKREIGILQAMGASLRSIALIFGTCGMLMGILSSLIGTAAALYTLHHIDAIVNLLSLIQGHNAFNAAFYGQSLPNQLSPHAVIFVLIATPIISLCAGLVPAIKACRLRPSAILRSE